MVVEVVRAYLEAASGLTELTRKHAVAVAKILIRESEERPGAPTRSSELPKNEPEGGEAALLSARVGPSIQALATELIETNQSNRAALSRLVEAEVARVLDRLDVVPREDYERLARRVSELERRLAAVTATQRRRVAAEEPESAVEAAAVTVATDQAPPSAETRSAETPSTEAAGVAEEIAKTAVPESNTPDPGAASTAQESAAEETGKDETAAAESTARGGKTKSGRARATKSQSKRAAARRSAARSGK